MQPEVASLLAQAVDRHRAGAAAEAEALYRVVIERDPTHPEARHNLGVVLAGREPEEALALFKSALEADPSQERYWISYIDTLDRAGRAAEAAEVLAIGRSRGLAGPRAEALSLRLEAGRLDPEALVQRIGQFYRETRLQEVVETARVLMVREPELGFGWTMCGAALRDLHLPGQAVPLLQRAVVLSPEDPAPLVNLGNCLYDLGRAAEAIPFYRRAIELGEDQPLIHLNLSAMLKDLHRYAEAETSCRRALELDPMLAAAHQALSTTLGHLSDYADVLSESDLAMAGAPPSQKIQELRLYTLSYHPELSAEAIHAEFERWGDQFPEPLADFSGHDRTPGRRLKIGYVSPDFRQHTSRFYFMPLMGNHDHRAFETFAYSNVLLEDEHTEGFKAVFDHWRDIRSLTPEEAAQRVRDDRIDILVDCCNHMSDHRLDVFALKPAPIQATWLGAAWTTGLKAVDYGLFDPYIAPAGTLARETIVRLPQCFIAYRPPETTGPVAPAPALRGGGVAFGYSGRTERLNTRVFRAWGEILRRRPDSRLVLDFAAFADPPTQDRFRRLFVDCGLDPARVEMRRSRDIFQGLGDIDILLDSFPHSGGTMLFDALWMGVPALTLKSRPPLGRIGTTLMTNLGMTDWVAESEEDYIAKAVAFAADLPGLAATRAGLRDRMRASPLMDEVSFARNVEAAYRRMWADWIDT